MRTIKFRAWDKANKIMHTPITLDEIMSLFSGRNVLNDVEWMQYTGLKDKNGNKSRELYKSDILYNSDREEYQVIVWNEHEARWDVRYSHGEQRSLADAIGNLNTYAGNIHENPELL